jgi:hypothetical protein
LGEISEDYDSAMIAAYLAQRETRPGLRQSAQKIPALDEQCDPGLCVAAMTFQAVRRIGPPSP